jgi:hypothetical protein
MGLSHYVTGTPPGDETCTPADLNALSAALAPILRECMDDDILKTILG